MRDLRDFVPLGQAQERASARTSGSWRVVESENEQEVKGAGRDPVSACTQGIFRFPRLHARSGSIRHCIEEREQ